jgi:hypothetical protein
MTFHQVNASLKATDNKEVAKTILDFFIYQHTQAFQEEINTRCELNACKAANTAAEREYKESQELGFGARLPYDAYNIEQKEKELERAQRDLVEAKALLDFIRDRFVEKFVL